MKRPGIDGGPLGFLTWAIPMLVGSLAYDGMRGWARGGVRAEGQASPEAQPAARPMAVENPRIAPMLVWGVILMALGYGMSCLNRVMPPITDYELEKWEEWERKQASAGTPAPQPTWLVEPPFVPPSQPVNLWTMSQRAGSVSYQTFGAGLSLAVYVLFVVACDLWGWRLGLLTTLGGNALAGYIIHMMVEDAIKPYTPKDSPLWFALAAFAVFFAICYLFLRHLEKNRLYLRL
jgi:hypothetical protein